MANLHNDHAATDDNDHVHGAMDTRAQEGTYQSFLVASQWGSVLIAAMIACMSLIWGADVDWMPAVLGCGALAIAAGIFMKMGNAFIMTSVLITLLGVVSGGISSLVGMFA